MRKRLTIFVLCLLATALRQGAGAITVTTGERTVVTWPCDRGELGRLTLDPRAGTPLIERLEIVDKSGRAAALLEGVDPVVFVTVGSREAPPGRPPEMSVFNVFFDSPAKRPYKTYRSELKSKTPVVRRSESGDRVEIVVDRLSAGPFRGRWLFHVYPGSRLVHVEAAISTNEEKRAFLYDFGLVRDRSFGDSLAWLDVEGRLVRESIRGFDADRSIAVRHRTLILESDGGSTAIFPPPHRFFFPRDLTDNLKTAWAGRGHRNLEPSFGFGIRQSETGGGAYVPWFNAPPGTEQRLDAFLLVNSGKAESALDDVKRYTNGDRFPPLPGYKTLASHWHMAITMDALKKKAQGISPAPIPDFVNVFKSLGTDLVHLGEFHGDGHPQDPGPLRLVELQGMFEECRRLSDRQLLFIPGEEANARYYGLERPGRHPGHWMCVFPKPVYWIMNRAESAPFVTDDPTLGKVHRVGNRSEMLELLKREGGLAWTAHPRIKASSWAPDVFRHEDFYKDSTWLGAAWKAMPADLSRDRLGERCLDLLDDMSNWGEPKYLPGEVDVFKIDHTHELYGHMNVNYIKLDQIPRFDDGWKPVLDALRSGSFFTTTGEMLMPDLSVGGRSSGETCRLPSDGVVEITFRLSWTFPPKFALLVSGDGANVYRERVDLAGREPFGSESFSIRRNLSGRKWARLEAWDVAVNGCYSQPIRLVSPN